MNKAKYLGFLGLLTFGAFVYPESPARAAALPHFKKVMIVIFENADYYPTVWYSSFSKFAKEGALLKNFHAETHPSQPNYIALVSGDLQGVKDDENIDLDAQHLGDLLEAKGKTWKTYAENYPGGCFLGAQSGTYVRKHTPFLSFRNVQRNPSRCARIVDEKELAKDIDQGTLPDFSLYIPDLNNDGHDTGAAYASDWFGKAFAPLLLDPRFMKDMLVIATFDEGFLGNHIYTALYGEGVEPGAVSEIRYNHYDLLRTIEEEFGLGTLGRSDARGKAIQGIWR